LPEPSGKDLVEDDADWAAVTYELLQGRIEAQRRKVTRIRVPDREEVERANPSRPKLGSRPSQWGLVCSGYQPELAAGWGTCVATFFAESKIDLAFEEGIFWVTTRTINCPYCMGHVEMGWELAGLTSPEIDRRARLLAGDDWSSFPPAEQRAYAFARKLTKAPWTVSADDVNALKRDFGTDQAVVVIWGASRCNYMTRVSNGFQLALERGNIFKDYFQKPKPRPESGREPSRR
jgi:alkylhydroperoxidase family enzyme